MGHVAHFNWATLRAPQGDPLVAEFFAAVGRVNAIAERSPGFVWRHGDEDVAGRAIGWSLFGGRSGVIASFSVWESEDALRAFVYKTVHGAFLRRGAEWFEAGGTFNHVLWAVEEGEIPGIAEARDRVALLEAEGPSARAWTLGLPPG